MRKDELDEFHKSVWKSQEDRAMQLITEDVCAMASRREKWSVIGYWSILSIAILFAAGFIRNLVQLRDPWLIAGTAWALVALCYLSWRIARHGPSKMQAAEPCAQFLCRELEGKRQGLLLLRLFSLLLIPAILVSWRGGGLLLRARTLGIESPWLLQLLKGPVPLIVMLLSLAIVWLAFSRQARKVAREIETLRSLEELS